MPEAKYTIGEKVYFQRPLLVGQIVPLLDALQGIVFESLGAMDIIRQLGPKLNEVLAVILIPEGVNIKNRDISEIEDHLENNLDVITALQIVSDFFAFSPPSLMLKEVSRLIDQGTAGLKEMPEISVTPLENSSEISAREI